MLLPLHENNDTIWMSSKTLCLEAFKKYFVGTLKSRENNLDRKSRYHMCLDNIGHKVRRISSSNFIKRRPKEKLIYLPKKKLLYVPVNWLNVLFGRDRNLKCDPAKTKTFLNRTKNKLTFYGYVIAFKLCIDVV